MSDDTRIAYQAEDEDAGERADVVLGRALPGVSRRMARALGLEGRLRIDGRKAKPSTRVSPGMRLELEVRLRGEPPPLTVLAEDEHFVFVDKPSGFHTHGLRPGERGTLSHAVALRFPECAQASPETREGGAVHRLDRDTSGVVAFARSRDAYVRARAAFTAGEVRKRYRAACAGSWPPTAPPDALSGWLVDTEHEGRPAVMIRAALGRGTSPQTVAVRLDGQRATTTVWQVEHTEQHVLVELALLTGRRHQARAHLTYVGLPIVGDPLYGRQDETRLHLHAVLLDLRCAGALDQVACPAAADFWPPAQTGKVTANAAPGPNNAGPT